MITTYKITDIDTILDALIADIQSNGNSYVEIDDIFNIKIKLEGEQWKGEINYQIANFIIELQNKIIKSYNIISESNINISSLHTFRNLVITVSVDIGCTELLVHFKEIAQAISGVAKNMESRHILYAILSIALITGGVIVHSDIQKCAIQKAKYIEEEETKRQFLKSTENIVKITSGNPHMNYMAREMSQEDKLTLDDKIYSKKEALTTFRKVEDEKETVRPETFFIDDRYEITVLYFEENTVKLTLNGITFKAITKFLSEEEKARLHEAYKLADIAQITPWIDLHIAAEILEGKIESAAVIGLGKKRAKSIPLKDALKKSMKNPVVGGLEQGTLIE